MTKRLLTIALFYFVLNTGGGTVLVGPFNTQGGCENYRAQVEHEAQAIGGASFGTQTFSCFSTKS
jgi:hypothetical protein